MALAFAEPGEERDEHSEAVRPRERYGKSRKVGHFTCTSKMVWIFFNSHPYFRRKLAHIRGVGWKEHWDFLGCLCDLSLPEGQQMVEEYLKELSNPPASLSQSLLEAREDSENPLLLSTPTSSSGTSVDRQHVFVGVSGQLFRSGDCEEVGALSPSADNNKDLETGVGDTVAVIDSLAELLEKNLSFNEDTDFHTCTNPTPTPPLSNKIFLAG